MDFMIGCICLQGMQLTEPSSMKVICALSDLPSAEPTCFADSCLPQALKISILHIIRAAIKRTDDISGLLRGIGQLLLFNQCFDFGRRQRLSYGYNFAIQYKPRSLPDFKFHDLINVGDFFQSVFQTKFSDGGFGVFSEFLAFWAAGTQNLDLQHDPAFLSYLRRMI